MGFIWDRIGIIKGIHSPILASASVPEVCRREPMWAVLPTSRTSF